MILPIMSKKLKLKKQIRVVNSLSVKATKYLLEKQKHKVREGTNFSEEEFLRVLTNELSSDVIGTWFD